MKRLSAGQKMILSEFFANSAVAWFSAGIIIPFFANQKLEEFILFGLWGLVFAIFFLMIALLTSKEVTL